MVTRRAISWALVLVAGIVFAIGYSIVIEQIDGLGLDTDTYRAGLWVMVVGLAVSGAAGITGAGVVRAIGKRLAPRPAPPGQLIPVSGGQAPESRPIGPAAPRG